MGLFNSTVLECAIGIVFVYLFLALLCTTINEWIAGVFAMRSRNLEKAISQLLDQQKGNRPTSTFLQDFYAHPLISGMMTPGRSPSAGHPSYLEARTFATAVMDLATPGQSGSITFADLESGVKNLPDGDVKTAILALLQDAKGDLDRAQSSVEHWFDDTMERASGWYKRRTQIITICVAVVLTVATNADTVHVARTLWTHGTERALMVERAKIPQGAGSVAVQDADSLKLVLGWPAEKSENENLWPSRILGWILSIVAISLGAPFWFDALSKLMNLRNAGEKPDKTPSTPPSR
jgi:hypothetical protein